MNIEFHFKDAELWLTDLAEELRKEYESVEEFEKEFFPKSEQLEGEVVELTAELYRITQHMQNYGAFEKWKVKELEIAMLKYLTAFHDSGMDEANAESSFITGLRCVRTMCERYVEILQVINEYISNEPQHSDNNSIVVEHEQQQAKQDIPQLRGTQQEKEVFEKALQKGLMVLYDGGYKWTKSKALLAYMCGRMYCGDKIKVDDNDDRHYKKGRQQLPAKELKDLFSENVGENRDAIKAPPRNYWIIDDLF